MADRARLPAQTAYPTMTTGPAGEVEMRPRCGAVLLADHDRDRGGAMPLQTHAERVGERRACGRAACILHLIICDPRCLTKT